MSNDENFDKILFDLFGITRSELHKLLEQQPKIISIKSSDYPNGVIIKVDDKLICIK